MGRTPFRIYAQITQNSYRARTRKQWREERELLPTSVKYSTWSFLELWTVCFKKIFLLKKWRQKCMFWCFSLEFENNIYNFATIQTMKFDRNQRFLLRYWMQTFEQIIEWQNHSFIDALFIDLKMLQFFKVIVPEGGMRGGGYFAPPPLDFSFGFTFLFLDRLPKALAQLFFVC